MAGVRRYDMFFMAQRLNIAIVGRCNSGKSTLLNSLLGQSLAIVSEQAGTTTDPVRRAVEIRGLGAVTMIDTAGVDDNTSLGGQRRRATFEVMEQCDAAILVLTPEGVGAPEREIIEVARLYELPLVEVVNSFGREVPSGEFVFDPATEPKERLHDHLAAKIKPAAPLDLFGERVSEGDDVVLVCPIDGEAPEGRLILPQVQALRQLLDKGAVAHVVQPAQLGGLLERLTPKMVVTDSQVIESVAPVVGGRAELTTFSILLAAAKGDLALYRQGLEALDILKEGDRVLIMESCLHHSGCDDIGRVKLPRWLEAHSGVKLRFEFLAGTQPLPDDVSGFALTLQCGGCMVTPRQIKARLRRLKKEGVPVTNYGMAIRKMRMKG